MMIIKIIIGQKGVITSLLVSFIALLSVSYLIDKVTSTDYDLASKKQEELNIQLQKYQHLYQEQLSLNQSLQAALESQNAQMHQEINEHDASDNVTENVKDSVKDNETFDDYNPTKSTASSSRFEQAVETFEGNTSIQFPLSSAVKASLFQMIPNDIPVNYKRVSSAYGNRLHPISGTWKRHLGMDLTCPLGTPIFATADGVVEITRPSNQGYGNLIKLRHAFGFMTLYAHLNQFSVKAGQFVEKGDRIGFCGSSGNSTGSHLHYEVRFIGKALNPKDFMTWKPEYTAHLFSQQKQVPWNSLIEQLNRTVNLQVLLAMSSKNQSIDTNHQLEPTPKKSAKRSNSRLQDFGLNEDGWTTVSEQPISE